MEAFDALQTVKKDLEGIFGAGLASLIIVGARTKAGAPVIGLTKIDYSKMVDVICSDSRVTGMLGAAATKDRLTKWKGFVN